MPFRDDLWALSYALKAHDIERGISWKKVYEEIKGDIQKVAVGTEKVCFEAPNVLLPLSVFYQFEIPVKRRFLTETLGLQQSDIQALVHAGEIVETDGMLSLHHSSLANLYLGAFVHSDLLGEWAKKRTEGEGKGYNWEDSTFYAYIKAFPEELYRMIMRLFGQNPATWLEIPRRDFKKTHPRDLIRGMTERNLGKISEFLNSKEEIQGIEQWLFLLAKTSPRAAVALFRALDKEALRRKAETSNVDTVFDFVIRVLGLGADKEEVEELISVVKDKVRKEDFETRFWALGWYGSVNDIVGQELLSVITPQEIGGQINASKDADEIGSRLFWIKRLGPQLRAEIVKHVDIKSIKDRVHALGAHVRDIALCIETIRLTNPGKAKSLVTGVNLSKLINKIQESDLEDALWCTAEVTRASEKATKKILRGSSLLRILADKLTPEQDPFMISECLARITDAREGIAEHLVRKMNMCVIAKTLCVTDPAGWPARLICLIAKARKASARELVDSLADCIDVPRLTKALLSESRTNILEKFAEGLSFGSPKSIRKFSPAIATKVDSTKNIRLFGKLLLKCFGTRMPIVGRLSETMGSDKMLDKIKGEDPRIIALFLSYVAEDNEEYARRLLGDLHSVIRGQVEKQKDAAVVCTAIYGVWRVDENFANELTVNVTSKLQNNMVQEKNLAILARNFCCISCASEQISLALAPIVRKVMLLKKDKKKMMACLRPIEVMAEDYSTAIESAKRAERGGKKRSAQRFTRLSAGFRTPIRILWDTDKMREFLFKLLADDSPGVGATAARICGAIGSSLLPALLRNLRSTKMKLRANSVLALGYIRDISVVEKVVPLLKDWEPVVQVYALDALGHLQTPDVIPSLKEVAEDDPLPEIREEARAVIRRIEAKPP